MNHVQILQTMVLSVFIIEQVTFIVLISLSSVIKL